MTVDVKQKKTMKAQQMACSCPPSWCAIERHTGRQDDGKTHERKKETRTDEQHMRGNFLWVNKEASGWQMSVKNTEVMEVIDLLKQQYTRRGRKRQLMILV